MAQNQVPFKTLEITVAAAQDLPPVSKMLRTFAVGWIDPDHKLSTKIDHHGKTKPTWNYKLVFRVDQKFLSDEAAMVTFEIYNVAWLRDLPIGTAYLFVNHIWPPLEENSHDYRPVALYIRQPSGHLQGILHVGVRLINNHVSSGASPFRDELSDLSFPNRAISISGQDNHHRQALQRQHCCKCDYGEDENDEKGNPSILKKQPSIKQPKTIMKNKSYASTNLSMGTIMHPLPSEVAFNLKNGLYAPEGSEYGSSVFENWSIPSHINAPESLRSKSGKWLEEDQVPLRIDDDVLKIRVKEDHDKYLVPKRRKPSGGLFSCFGKGFEFTFSYGSKIAKKRRKNSHSHDKMHVFHHDRQWHRFQI